MPPRAHNLASATVGGAQYTAEAAFRKLCPEEAFLPLVEREDEEAKREDEEVRDVGGIGCAARALLTRWPRAQIAKALETQQQHQAAEAEAEVAGAGAEAGVGVAVADGGEAALGSITSVEKEEAER